MKKEGKIEGRENRKKEGRWKGGRGKMEEWEEKERKREGVEKVKRW